MPLLPTLHSHLHLWLQQGDVCPLRDIINYRQNIQLKRIACNWDKNKRYNLERVQNSGDWKKGLHLLLKLNRANNKILTLIIII